VMLAVTVAVRVAGTTRVGAADLASNLGRATSAAIPRAYRINTASVITPSTLQPICWDWGRKLNHRMKRLTNWRPLRSVPAMAPVQAGK
jgi:hypothetical protein